ncbi:MAG: hypothetical protein N2748_05875, partial [candidate division WOR-3 bacterium]|nr:hypothetical protein [candidate division WOR-3 bacterium]
MRRKGLAVKLGFAFLLLVFNFSVAEQASLGKIEKDYISKALQIQGISEKELGFEKKYASDSGYRLSVVTDLMDNPLKTPDYLDKSVSEINNFNNKITPQLVFLSQQLDINISNSDVAKINRELDNNLKKYGNGQKSIFEQIENIFRVSFPIADRYLKQAMKNLSEKEINQLLIIAPVLWSDEDDSINKTLKGALHREFRIETDTSIKIELDTILEIVKKVDRYALSMAGCAIGTAIDKSLSLLVMFKPAIEQYKKEMTLSEVPEVKGAVYAYDETEWGKFVIGSEQDNVYQENYTLLI